MEKLIAVLSHARHVLIITHENPDGDAIGSLVALRAILSALGKEVIGVCRDGVPEPFQFLALPGSIGLLCDVRGFDTVVAVDCGDLRRTGFPKELIQFRRQGGVLAHIDHHPRSDLSKLASVAFEDANASSTAELIWRLNEQLGAKMTKEISTALLLGLYTDTGGFRHSNTTPAVLQLGATLLSLGARLRWIREHVVMHKSISALRLWGIAFERIHNHRLAIISSVVTAEDLVQTGATEEDISGIVNMLGAIINTRLAMLISGREGGMLKASMRTEDEQVDVGAIAALFGGGGHRKAAGFAIPGKIFLDGDRWRLELFGGESYTKTALLAEITS